MNYCNVDETDYDLLQSVDDADLKFNVGDAQFEVFQGGCSLLQNISVWGKLILKYCVKYSVDDADYKTGEHPRY